MADDGWARDLMIIHEWGNGLSPIDAKLFTLPRRSRPGYSERQTLIRDTFWVLAWMELNEIDDMVDAALFRLKPLPTKAQILFPQSKISQIIYYFLLSDRALLEEQLQLLITNQYLQPHPTPKP
ncbi:hypothetical protein VP01_1868g3, partial [Puccinia sorghi]